MRAVMALSGGMDSTSLLLNLIRDGFTVSCISYDYGQKHSIELERAKNNIQYLNEQGIKVEHKIANLRDSFSIFQSSLLNEETEVPKGHYEEESMKSTFVPNRNAIFSSILYGYALSIANREKSNVSVALGVHSGDHAIYPDCRPEFYNALEHAFAIGNWDSEKIKFLLPYIEGDKVSILSDAMISCQQLDLDFNKVFKNTITSYQPDSEGRSNGATGSDVERILAFHKLGLQDPVEYVEPWDVVLHNALKIQTEHNEKRWKDELTDLQYAVTRQGATERPFTGKYDKHFEKGVYNCICCGKKLFTSEGKYNSGCGWPAFHTEETSANISRIQDFSHGMSRTEVKCSDCDSHLGHVFNDGPRQFGGERYCINSASLDFIEE